MQKFKFSLSKLAILLALTTFGQNAFATESENTMSNMQLDNISSLSLMKNSKISALLDDQRVFKIDPTITTYKVSFINHYGFDVVGHLYLPNNFKADQKYPALVISGPFGAVKEQVSGLYAQELAKAGFVAVAFDQSFTGESSGTPRNMASPDIFTEDFSAAVDFITNLDFVDANKIGAIGICGLSGMAVTAAINDPRIKAVTVSAMYDMSKSISDHYKGVYYTKDQRNIVKEHIAKMRDQEAKLGTGIAGTHELGVSSDGSIQSFSKMFPDELPKDADPVTTEFFNYYVKRAFHPRSINSAMAWDATAPLGFFNFDLMANIQELAPRPILLVTGSKAHSKYFSDDVYSAAADPKQIIVVKDATHTDLYDNMELIPFDQIINFFKGNLK